MKQTGRDANKVKGNQVRCSGSFEKKCLKMWKGHMSQILPKMRTENLPLDFSRWEVYTIWGECI